MHYLLTLLLVSGLSLSTGALADAQDTNDHDEAHEHNDHNETDHDEDHQEQGHHDEHGVTHIAGDIARQVGIETAIVGNQSLSQTMPVYGRLMLAPEQVSHVHARFPGVIKSVKVTIGDTVNTGDLLAVVESNESLKTYSIFAPISGVITERHANTGETTQSQVLFAISNFDAVWASLKIFPSQRSSVSVGQRVRVIVDGQDYNSTIKHILPSENNAPFVNAWAEIQPIADEMLAPGLLVEANIISKATPAELAIENIALQELEGRTGVFVVEGEAYRFKAVSAGLSDKKFTQLLPSLDGDYGIETGEQYVTKGSYLIKADIEKSEAEHVH